MEEALIEILDSFDCPVFRQGSMNNEAKYPETFITFWNNEAYDHAYYDNGDYLTNWSFNVYIYSTSANTAYQLTAEIRGALKSRGWIVPTKGYDVMSDEETHTGRGLDCYYLGA